MKLFKKKKSESTISAKILEFQGEQVALFGSFDH